MPSSSSLSEAQSRSQSLTIQHALALLVLIFTITTQNPGHQLTASPYSSAPGVQNTGCLSNHCRAPSLNPDGTGLGSPNPPSRFGAAVRGARTLQGTQGQPCPASSSCRTQPVPRAGHSSGARSPSPPEAQPKGAAAGGSRWRLRASTGHGHSGASGRRSGSSSGCSAGAGAELG